MSSYFTKCPKFTLLCKLICVCPCCRDVGKISFSLEARLWNGLNDYDDFSEIVAPISSISSAAVSSLRGLAANAGLVNQLVDEDKLKDRVLMGKVKLSQIL